jgi:hypothetical protein
MPLSTIFQLYRGGQFVTCCLYCENIFETFTYSSVLNIDYARYVYRDLYILHYKQPSNKKASEYQAQ